MTTPVTHFLNRMSDVLEQIQTSNRAATGLIEEHKEVSDELSGVGGESLADQAQAESLRRRRADIEDELLGLLRAHMRI